MSFSKKVRNFRANDGKDGPEESAMSFAVAIARALEDEFGDTPSKVKIVARLTGANEKTVKNWFCARNGPNGESLVELMRHSRVILQLILSMAGHEDLLEAMKIAMARDQLRTALSALDELLGEPDEPIS